MLRHVLLFVFGICVLAATRSNAKCVARAKINKATLAGKEVQQKFVHMEVAGGRCLWVKEGSTPTAYTLENCGSCRASDSGAIYCKGSGQMRAMEPCKMVIGPNCRWYSVFSFDHTAKCNHATLLEDLKAMLAARK